MTWNIVLYAAASILISIGCGIVFRERNKKYHFDDDFSVAAFIISIGLFIIAGLFIHKFNILC